VKRIYYLLDDIGDADSISTMLHKSGIADWQFHVLAKDEDGLYKHHLHRANFLQKKDLVHSGQRGVLVGGVAGLYLSLFIVPWSLSSTPLFASILIALVTVGVVSGGILGSFHENHKIARFHDDIEQGQLLIMLDIRKHQLELVTSLIKLHYPELKPVGNGSMFSKTFTPGPRIRH